MTVVDPSLELVRAVREEYARAADAKHASEQLPEEVEEGNVEYKLKLNDPAPGACVLTACCMRVYVVAYRVCWLAVDRVKHLTTQLHWRLNEGKGTAFYEVGVCDNGDPEGIPEELMIKSVCTLAR